VSYAEPRSHECHTSVSIFIVLSVGLPSVMILGDRGEDQCCAVSIGWNGGDSWISSGDVDSHARIC
jgi:hypothetical protein